MKASGEWWTTIDHFCSSSFFSKIFLWMVMYFLGKKNNLKNMWEKQWRTCEKWGDLLAVAVTTVWGMQWSKREAKMKNATGAWQGYNNNPFYTKITCLELLERFSFDMKYSRLSNNRTLANSIWLAEKDNLMLLNWPIHGFSIYLIARHLNGMTHFDLIEFSVKLHVRLLDNLEYLRYRQS